MASPSIMGMVLCAISLSLVTASESDRDSEFEKFVLIGKERTVPYDQFTGLPPEICSTLKTVYLEYIQFDPNVLIESLKSCTELRNISLVNVESMGRLTKKLTLPKLETFSFTMHQMQANSAEEFMTQLFFYNPDSDPVVPSTVTLLVGSIMTGESIEYDSSKRRLELNLFTYDLTKYFEYNELSFHRSHVELNALKFSNLTTLYLYNDHYDDDLFEVLRSAEKLIDLRVYQMRHDGIFQDLSVDLSIFPAISEFKLLVLQHARVGSTKPIALRNLSSLTLFKCEFNTSMISISSSVYKLYLENVTFYGTTLDSFVSPMSNLTYVTLDYTENENQQFDIANLRNSSRTLEDLSFYGLNLQLSSPEVEFQNLTEVAFSECEFSRNADGKFRKAFSSVTWLAVSDCNISHLQLQELLMNPSVELFYFSRNEVELPEIEKFLLDSGVPASVKSPKMKKSNDTSTGWSYIKNLSRLQNPALRDTALYTYVLVLLVICGIGIVGNILSGIVLTRKSMQSSTSCILLGLTICDCVILTTYACSLVYFGIKLILVFLNFTISIDDQAYHIFGFQVTEEFVKGLDKFQYRFLYPLNKTAYTGSVYATILLTVERYIAVCWPFYVRRVLQVKTAVCSTILVFVFAVALNIPRWIEAHQYSSQVYLYIPNSYDETAYRAVTLHFARNTLGSGLLRNRFYRQYYHGLLWVTLMYIIPISGLNFFNLKILAQLKQSKQNRNSMTSARQNKDHKEMASLTKMLLCVIMIFVICNSVSGVIVWSLIWYGGWDPSDIEVFSCIPLIINSSINFVIYALLGTKFRRELRRVIYGWVRCLCRIEIRQEGQNNMCMNTMTSTT